MTTLAEIIARDADAAPDRWLCHADRRYLLELLREARDALYSISTYDCVGGVSRKHCPGCASCDAVAALDRLSALDAVGEKT